MLTGVLHTPILEAYSSRIGRRDYMCWSPEFSNLTVLESTSKQSMPVMTRRRAASGGIEGMEQLTTAGSLNGM